MAKMYSFNPILVLSKNNSSNKLLNARHKSTKLARYFLNEIQIIRHSIKIKRELPIKNKQSL